MEQIKQILAQMSLNLELNIAICDMIEDHEIRIKSLEASSEAQKVRVNGLYTRMSEFQYAASSLAYDKRRGSGSEK